jgi:hypothetical protein
VPHLREVIAFEHALIRAHLYGDKTVVDWTADPTEILGALDQGRLPDRLPAESLQMTVA